ncbi:hypothetical protein V1283_006530 [Bradyrhizobium sp. AZCC 2262]|uniref:hypothetical protein n=1 Tax=Bradyrhizobium sp. AZCC 2262 TaxID=3117022 RepID=UPI002FEFA55D
MGGLRILALAPMILASGPASMPASIDATVSCKPSSDVDVYRCGVRIIDIQTGFPLCIRGTTVELQLPARRSQEAARMELSADSNGNFREIEIKVPNTGRWQLLVRAGASTIVKHVEFRATGPTER